CLLKRDACVCDVIGVFFFFFSSRRRHTRFDCDWSSDVCSSDLPTPATWAINQVARSAPRAVAKLIEAGRTLREAQTELKSGDERSEERRVGKECRSRGWGCD